MTTQDMTPQPPDPLKQAAEALDALDTVPLEQHPNVFTRFDELLREALESPPQVGSG